MADLKALETKGDQAQRQEWKFRLTQQFYKQG